jgi:cytochrome P450
MLRPPGPKARAIRRRLLAVRRDPLSFLFSLSREYGDVVFFDIGPFDVYLLSHPEDIRTVLAGGHHAYMKGRGLQEAKRILGQGLLTSEGDLHRRQRRLVQPAFHHQRLAGYAALMSGYAERAQDRWRDGEALDVHQAMTALTLAIVGKALFDADVEEDDAAAVREALSAAMDMFDRFTLPFAGLLDRLPLPGNRRFAEARASLDDIVYGLIRERRLTGDRGDLLSMLLAAQDEEEGTGGMTDEQVRDEAMTIFLAGHETTSNALTWTWYLLSQHPDVEAELQREIDEVLLGRLPTIDDVPDLRIARMVVTEAMRLYPPAWVLGRRALEDHSVAGYTMPAGAMAVMSQYVVHHDPRWFPDPFGFNPGRWTPQAESERPRYSYFPFGGGPRICVGESFAWTELVLVLATIARRWELRLLPGHPVELAPLITLRPKHGMRMTVHRRHGSPGYG